MNFPHLLFSTKSWGAYSSCSILGGTGHKPEEGWLGPPVRRRRRTERKFTDANHLTAFFWLCFNSYSYVFGRRTSYATVVGEGTSACWGDVGIHAALHSTCIVVVIVVKQECSWLWPVFLSYVYPLRSSSVLSLYKSPTVSLPYCSTLCFRCWVPAIVLLRAAVKRCRSPVKKLPCYSLLLLRCLGWPVVTVLILLVNLQ